MTLDGPILYQVGSWLGINVMWLKPILVPIAIWLDDFFGNGNPIDEKKWWLDLEVIGRRSFKYDPENHVESAKGVNRPMIKKNKKQTRDDNIAHFPASTLPQPDMMEPYPTDRKLGLKLASEAETVEQGLLRRKNGGKVPETYIPSYKNAVK
jgi:hypothetical protein